MKKPNGKKNLKKDGGQKDTFTVRSVSGDKGTKKRETAKRTSERKEGSEALGPRLREPEMKRRG